MLPAIHGHVAAQQLDHQQTGNWQEIFKQKTIPTMYAIPKNEIDTTCGSLQPNDVSALLFRQVVEVLPAGEKEKLAALSLVP
jgi:hypothetical protein